MEGFSLNAIDVSIIIGSLVLVVLVGLWASRNQEKTERGYFLAGNKLPWYIIGAAYVSTSVSSEQIVGTVGVAYENGMGVANWEWIGLPVMTLTIVFFIPIYLKNRIITVPEMLTKRYGPICGNVYSWVMLLAYVFIFMVPVLYGGTLAISKLTGWNFYNVLWVMIFLIALYTIKGGLSSVMWTDAVQCAMLVGGGLILFFVALGKIPGGWAAMEQANPERFHLYKPPNDPIAPFAGIICGIFGVFIFYTSTNQVMIQRVLGARSTWDGIMGIIFSAFINLLRPLVTCFLGLIIYHWIVNMKMDVELANKDLAFPYGLKVFAGTWGLRGIVLTGFIAAVMSTISALANSTSTIFSIEVYKKMINKTATQEKLVLMGRIASFIALVTAGLVAPSVERLGGIFEYFQTGVTFLAAPFAVIMIVGIIWKRANYQGGIFVVTGGLVITALALLIQLPIEKLLRYKLFLRLNLHWLYAAAFVAIIIAAIICKRANYWRVFRAVACGIVITAMAVTVQICAVYRTGFTLHWLYAAVIVEAFVILGIVIVSLLTPAPPKEKWEPFYWRPSVLTRFDEGVSRPWYKKLKLWFVIYAIIWFIIYWHFW